jgi:uncharacterized membrane protein YbhN (UPF0104 family)
VKLRRRISLLVSIGALFLFAFYIFANAEKYETLLNFSPILLCATISLILCGVLTNGLVNFFLYRGLGAQVGLNESVGLAAVNTLANLLPFAAGMVTKGIYLKHRYRLAYSHYISATLSLYVFFLSTAGIVGLFTLTGRWLLESEPASSLLLLGFGIMAGSLVALWLPIRKMPLPKRWEDWILKIMEGWQVLSRNKALVFSTTFVYLLMMLSISGRYWIAFHVLSQEVTFGECVLFAAASILTQLVSFTPGGLGVREGIVAAVAAVHNIPLDISVVAVGIDRLVATTVVAAVGTAYSLYLRRKAAEKEKASSSTNIQIDIHER